MLFESASNQQACAHLLAVLSQSLEPGRMYFWLQLSAYIWMMSFKLLWALVWVCLCATAINALVVVQMWENWVTMDWAVDSAYM